MPAWTTPAYCVGGTNSLTYESYCMDRGRKPSLQRHTATHVVHGGLVYEHGLLGSDHGDWRANRTSELVTANAAITAARLALAGQCRDEVAEHGRRAQYAIEPLSRPAGCW